METLLIQLSMKEVEPRRIVPISLITLLCIVFLAVFQLFFITASYELKSSAVKRFAPFLYQPFRLVVGEHPSSKIATGLPDSGENEKKPTSMASVAGINPEELSVTIEDVEPAEEITEDQPKAIIPVSEPKKEDPLDSDEPVG